MSAVSDILKQVTIPKMVRVKQSFPRPRIEDVKTAVLAELKRPEIAERLKPGKRIAVGVGSRGITNYQLIVRTIVDELKRIGAKPFIVASMGSHGGATVEGQTEILAGYGITEEAMGCPLCIGTGTQVIGTTQDGLPVQIDAFAAQADGIIVVNRIKAHTAFMGDYESGLMKMLAIGLAKQAGADYCHAKGFGHMAETVPKFGKAIIQYSKLLFGLAIVENAYDDTYIVRAVPAESIAQEEPKLLLEAKANMSRILIPEADVLIVHEIGKNISGDGMDPNVSGTFATPYAHGGIKSQRVAVLNITQESHGNTVGWGMADVSTRKAFDSFDMDKTYPNSLTCRVTQVSKVPMIFQNDEECIKAAIKTCADVDVEHMRIVYIKNTLHMKEILVSEALVDIARSIPQAEVCGECEPLTFDEQGNISDTYF
ncbi:lactate racemase domain-containing protein [Enterocloster lavalensis]|uniref:lactate racemase domain-containing protein n=1 Tax=Enterocloster lavalensis TaxID=460384 RepID=UPI001D071AB3|nr:lactate racemase domain-containing protein [Enterocloster lavalensis]MCB6345247.1 lactate racemase domain-containing protein [Enterocloster lavalensis]